MRRGQLIITENEKNEIRSLYNLIKESLITEQVVNISTSGKTTFEPMSTDPKNFLGTFVADILKKINEDPAAKKMMDSGQMVITSIVVATGASNSWDGKATGYDNENDYRTPFKGQRTETVLYDKNKKLSLDRGNGFKDKVFAELSKYKIQVSPNVKVTVLNNVVNTGGLNDNKRDTTKYPNPGQYLSSRITFMYKKDIPTTTSTTLDFTKITSFDKIPANFVLAGSYFCDGKNSENAESENDTYLQQCAKLPSGKHTHDRISAWEIKWGANVAKNPRVVPVIRWNFFWSPEGKIVRVFRQNFNSQYQGKELFDKMVPSKDVNVDDPALKYFMGIKEGDVNGGTTYKKYIAPFK